MNHVDMTTDPLLFLFNNERYSINVPIQQLATQLQYTTIKLYTRLVKVT